MQLLTGFLLTSCILVQADSEAFFIPNLLSRSSSRNQPVRHHFRQKKQVRLPQHQHHNSRHVPRPARQIPNLFSNINPINPLNLHLQPLVQLPHHQAHHASHGRHPRVHPPPAPVRTDPGVRMKLDYGGWTPIGFDEDLPAKLKRGIKIEELKSVSDNVHKQHGNQIVTIDTAIASAPPAQSDDLHHQQQHTTHTKHFGQAPAAPQQPSQPIYIPSTADTADNEPSSIVYVDSSNAPVATYNVLDANNPAVAPQYEPSNKPSFQAPQYIPRPAVPSKPYKPQPPTPTTPRPTPRYQPKSTTKAPAPRYQPAPAVPPQYEEPAGAVLPAHVPSHHGQHGQQHGGVDNNKYPIVALITADSDVPDNEKFVQFSINGGSPDTLPASDTVINLDTNTRNAKDVTKESDELYYIYYQDPELDPSFGAKIQSERDASNYLGVEGLDIPLYDYDEATDHFRQEREQPIFGAKSSSSVSFKQNIGGQRSQFSYNLS